MRYLIAVAILLACAAAAYARGASLLWRAAGVGRGISIREIVSFGAGLVALSIALEPPVVDIASESFTAHMIQHETLMLLAAPLLVMSRPIAAWSWAMPFAWRRRAANCGVIIGAAALWHAVTRPVAATFIQLAVLWIGHAPRLFDAATEHPWLHALQHLAFFVAALAFWTAMLARRTARDQGAGAALLFITMLGAGALGALLTFSRTPWYAAYASVVSANGLTPLEDQQLGGLVMWIPGGIPYMAAALWLFGRSLRFFPRRAVHGER